MKTYYIAGAALIALIGMGLTPLRADANPTHPRVHEVNHRLKDQHGRIAQGVKSGQLTRHETASLRAKDARVRYQEHRDRLAHSGHLTHNEYKHLNKELNHDSRSVYRDKHNDKVR